MSLSLTDRSALLVYAWAGCDIVAHVGAFPNKPAFFVADPAAVKVCL
jgi:hypothetical protein